MSSDGYFDDDDTLDDAALNQLDAIEAAHVPTARVPKLRRELEKLDTFIEESYQGKAQPVAGPSRTSSRATLQTTLFGEVLPPPAPKAARAPVQRTGSTSRNPFGQQAPKTKKWDHTEFAKSGVKGRSKGKEKAVNHHDDEEEEQLGMSNNLSSSALLTPSLMYCRPPPPMKLKADLLEAKHWIYPLNHPKRDYQYNIVRHCLFDNTIVALPTGLGKTFVAGVVMLNYYRWFPEGKVVFVAPTKPLVAQQIEASHKTCGIPGSDAVELTGQNAPALRARAWQEKRVFYMTPQTFINDLVKETVDARDIILLVIDEAHRATGGYAYNQVVRFMMAKNPHFRILALTATPGSDPEAVQNLVDGLHISRIEIRDENSLDLKAYIHRKKVEEHVIRMTAEVNRIKDLLVTLMNSVLKPLEAQHILHGNPEKMHPYAPQAKMSQLAPTQRWAYSSLSKWHLWLIECTIGMCNTYMQDLASDKDANPEGGKKKPNKLREDPLFKAVLKELEIQRLGHWWIFDTSQDGASQSPDCPTFRREPGRKWQRERGDQDHDFASYRETVEEIVDYLNLDKPLIRANPFIGQATDKQGRKGMSQKEQLDVIKRFKAGEFNVLVATSIGEEGLDIGEVDLIICYDAQKTPIRMLQRFGRTGRKREGKVHVLLAEIREEENMHQAKVTYKEVQKSIVRGDQLELYGDVGRLLPERVKPECLEKVMEIQEYVREDGRKKRANSKERPAKGTKRKRNDDMFRNIPTGASTGFVSVSKLLVKGASNKRKKIEAIPKDFEEAGMDDDDDKEIEAGISEDTEVEPAEISHRGRWKKKKKSKEKLVIPTPSQFALNGVDDEDDMDIERGIIFSPQRTKINSTDVIEIDSEPDMPDSAAGPSNMAWLLDDEDSDNPDLEIVNSSPILDRRKRKNPSPARSDSSGAEPFRLLTLDHDSVEAGVDPDESVQIIEPTSVPRRLKPDMPPPELPLRLFSSPQASFPVRAPARRARSLRVEEFESPVAEKASPRKRLSRRESRKIQEQTRPRPETVYAMEALHSGDEVSEGSSDSDVKSDSSDHRFLEGLPETQMSPSYDQSLAYRQSLLTQAPGGPAFANRPTRRGMFGGGLNDSLRRRVQVSSSPTRDEDDDRSPLLEDDRQTSGSFIVYGTSPSTVTPVSSIVSSIPRSDILVMRTAAMRRADLARFAPQEPGWTPWVSGTWAKWVRGSIMGYRDFAGREAHPGTYDSLSHLLFSPLPTSGSSGGPIVEEESGAVVGVVVGTRMDNRVQGLQGWGVPSEIMFEMFSLPGFGSR
ncbi:hypothetical protein FB45DRAFT_1027891 [Roridomyces roridus]|uniref:ATP-dependent DNA helicase n=1 Tax=Roridomyces roridus TaxID=1738132 RepID=A0AAD7FL48_9AGAR|nr:hypothetical protein FB45DRAFT_1027891 [Roridomyces roridus]